MRRMDIINYYLWKMSSPKSYLEIGVGNPIGNFNLIKADIKTSVSKPESGCNYKYDYPMKSDKFFKINKRKYDVIFIDGLHIFTQSYKDFLNAEKFITNRGIIILHDCCPIAEEHQLENNTSRTWNGTVWKTFVKLRCERDDLEMFVIDTDWGVGIVRKGKQKLFKTNEDIFNYKVFDKHRKEVLNLLSLEEWKLNENIH